MFSHNLMLFLLALTCVQLFTTAHNGKGPRQCCFRFPKYKIPLRVLKEYKETDRQCAIPGVIFTVKNGSQFCADPEERWVQSHMNKIDQRLFNIPTQK